MVHKSYVKKEKVPSLSSLIEDKEWYFVSKIPGSLNGKTLVKYPKNNGFPYYYWEAFLKTWMLKECFIEHIKGKVLYGT